MEEPVLKESNIGGSVTDFIGTMRMITDLGYLHQTMDPNGINRFEGKTAEEMVGEYKASGHSQNLDILLQSVEDNYKDDEKKPDFYKQVTEVIQKEIDKQKGSN